LLVPYFSWKYTHGQHHSGTCDMARDTVFLPATTTEFKETDSKYADTPIRLAWMCVVMLVFGWPSYLISNISGQKYKSMGANHFNPDAPFFRPNQRRNILLSDIGVGLTILALVVLGMKTSFWTLFAFYIVPYCLTNSWLVTITYLQHTHVDVPHYRGSEWNFVRGALATVDRDYGMLNFFHHHICDSHVVHHLFSTMPFYNAIQATPYVKQFLGEHYNYDNTPVFKSLWNTFTDCGHVDDEGTVVHYNPANKKF
jgi:omega-6 fatty acid desaturase (delta-12 desaturase)